MENTKASPFWGPIVLGMHDAMVSTIGLITGVVFASGTQYVVILTGIIGSVAAGLSMAASEYLALRADAHSDSAFWRGISTGVMYIFTAALLLMPFMFISNTFWALGMTYIVAISTIWFFNFVKSRISKTPFWPRFLEMLGICAIVTAAAFIIGEGAKIVFGIEI